MAQYVDSVTMTGDGTFDRRIKAYQNQIDALTERIADIDAMLELRRQDLYEKYYQMELILGELNAESQYLTTQLDSLNVNWKFNQKD